MRISDWSSDVCSSDLRSPSQFSPYETVNAGDIWRRAEPFGMPGALVDGNDVHAVWRVVGEAVARARSGEGATLIEARTYRWRTHVESEESFLAAPYRRSEEHTSELQSLMRISYAVFCLKKKPIKKTNQHKQI